MTETDVFLLSQQEGFTGLLPGSATHRRAEVIAINSKTSCLSGSRKNSKELIHIVSAFAGPNAWSWAVVVAEKSNEIVTIPPNDRLVG